MDSQGMPQREHLLDYKNAVAGHAGTLCDPDGVLFIKPCTQAEIDFYEAAKARNPELYSLLPIYMGTLTLSNVTTASDAAGLGAVLAQQPPSQPEEPHHPHHPHRPHHPHHPHRPHQLHRPHRPHLISPSPQSQAQPALPTQAGDKDIWIPRGSLSIFTDRAIVLENTTFGYKKPNVVDVKLGQRLWADDAPANKRQRMDQVRSSTTHDKLGFRIAGMRVYKGPVDGAGADQDDAAAGASVTASTGLDNAGYKVYDKNFGRFEVNENNVVDAFRQYIYNERAGIDADTGRKIANYFKADLERVRDVLEKERTRMYSASLLFVFEGDGATFRAAYEVPSSCSSVSTSPSSTATAEIGTSVATGLAAAATISMATAMGIATATATATATAMATATTVTAAATTTATETDNIVDRKSRQKVSPSDNYDNGRAKLIGRSTSRTDSGIEVSYAIAPVEDEDEDGNNDENDDNDDDDDEEGVPPAYGLKLIDFAHATFVSEDEGPDENVLVGIRSLIRIFDELSK